MQYIISEHLSFQRFQHTFIEKYCFKELKNKNKNKIIVCLSRCNQKGFGAHLAQQQHTTNKMITINQMMTSV